MAIISRMVRSACLGKYSELGFSLQQEDDHILELWFKDQRIARFSATGATLKEIKKECHRYLENLNDKLGWEACR